MLGFVLEYIIESMKKCISVALTIVILTGLVGCGSSRDQAQEDNTTWEDANSFLYEFDTQLHGVVIIRYIGENADVVIPSEIDNHPVKSINDSAFAYCNSLISITIPDSVTSIGGFAFRDCTNLTTVDLPRRLKTISNFMFAGCESLTSISIPDRVTSIYNNAFSGCHGLESVDIPKSVKGIGPEAFSDCWSLSDATREKILGISPWALDDDVFTDHLVENDQ